jgi:molybdopterin-dependent oxidoreductase alpha subunit
MARTRPRRRDLWAGWRPNGIGETKPNHYGEILRAIWANRRHLPYAARIVRKGVCDGCALGVAGLHDWTIDGVHLCATRLSLLSTNTMGAADPSLLADVERLRRRRGRELRSLGRLGHPMMRRAGEPGFTRVSWDAALEAAADAIRPADPERVAFYLTSRGITNEVYYVAQKVARFLGTNNVDNAARVCHAPSTGALKQAVGAIATTVSYRDLMETDLVVLWGANVANAQPVMMKYLYLARREGTRVAVVNPHREPGLERYWVPSSAESALLGTRMSDAFFQVHVGGDEAFATGVLKLLIEEGGLHEQFLRDHATGFEAVRERCARHTLADLGAMSGVGEEGLRRFADMYRAAESAVFVWSMGITQHAHGSDNVRALLNVALARGSIGRPGAGLMPIRGHSGVQGGAEMGAYATAFPGNVAISPESARALAEQYGFAVPGARGLTAEEMLEAAGRGELDVLYASGGNFLDVLPDSALVAERLGRVPVRVHQDIVVSSQMLVDPPPGGTVILLPAATRYEQEGGGTQTTTERRIAFSPEIPGPRTGEARAEWRIYLDLARQVAPERAHLVSFADAQAIREEIARVVPFYDGIQRLRATGDQVQWGGARLCDGWVFPTSDGKAHFHDVAPRDPRPPSGRYLLSSRRGKQFNSMVFDGMDPLTGAVRDALFVSPEDAAALGLAEGAPVLVRSATGEVEARAHVARLRPGNVQMFWPECNAVIEAGVRDPDAFVPDYNAVVELIPRRSGAPRPGLRPPEGAPGRGEPARR